MLALLMLVSGTYVLAQNKPVVMEFEKKISDFGLFFDGVNVPQANRLTHPNRTDGKYDFAFGSRITPHGDCVAHYGDYVFLTWYKGGKSNRQVMLTRINVLTKSEVTIEFPHTHTGFQNRWWVGESHNTIAVGVCPIDKTVHMLYDMHAYSPSRPADGSLANDFFRYSVSEKNVATLPDEDFTLDKFLPKRLYLKQGFNYQELTYPVFFVNTNNELLVKMRVGGNNNGKFQMAKYDGDSWSNWVDYNVLNAKGKSNVNYNWGLYGDFQYLHGKFRIGYVIRKNDNNDRYLYNNGFFYSYSNALDGSNDWYNYKDQQVSSPLINPYEVFISEPGDNVTGNVANSVVISSQPVWTVTERGDIHFMISGIRGANNQNVNVHTYKKAGDAGFTTTTSFPGGTEVLGVGNDIYLIGLSNGRPFIRKAEGGTNNWTLLYQATTGKSFRHGNVLAKNGKVYYFLMENKSGSAQPIYLQVYDLGINDVPSSTNNIENNIFKVFPNPSQGRFTIEAEGNSSYSIYSTSGICISKGNFNNNLMLDIKEHGNGVYLLKVNTASGTYTQKVVVAGL